MTLQIGFLIDKQIAMPGLSGMAICF